MADRPAKKAKKDASTSTDLAEVSHWTSAPHDRVAAVIAGHCDVATLEAEIEADPAPLAIQDEHGETPLHLALNRGSTELVGTLVKKGAPVGAGCSLGYTAIHLAAQKGTTALFEALLPDIGDGGLDALAKGQLLNATLEGGQTALHLAAQNCNVAAVRALLSHGAEVGPVIPLNGNTPLHVICKKTLGPASADDAVAIIKLLVGRGADLGAANVDGDRPLHLAVMSSGTKAWAVSALLEVQASPEVVNDDGGDTPLHLAAQYNKVEAATLLIAAGADATRTNMYGETPSQLARTKKIRGLFS